MKLPSKIVDISQPLDNDTVVDPSFMRPKIEYVTGEQNAELMTELFPGLKKEDLPGGQGWAIEYITLATHNGTHVDAPYHYNSHDKNGNPMPTIDEMPLDWYFRPGVKLDFRHLEDGYVATAADVEAELARIGYELQPMDIVLVNTRAGEMYGSDDYIHSGCGVGREATHYLTERGVRVTEVIHDRRLRQQGRGMRLPERPGLGGRHACDLISARQAPVIGTDEVIALSHRDGRKVLLPALRQQERGPFLIEPVDVPGATQEDSAQQQRKDTFGMCLGIDQSQC